MTLTDDADRHLQLTHHAYRHLAEAWDLGLEAVLEHDVRAARQVMRGATTRRSMLRTAHEHLQWDESLRPTGTSRRPASQLVVIADLMRMNRLLGQIAQLVIAAPSGAAGTLDDRDRARVEVARRVGAQRLRQFAESTPRPVLDRAYVAAGHELLDALAALAEHAPRRGSATDLCLALVVTMIEVSRHTTRIA
ncbi:hypothetical protein GEV29_07610 [Aeromicrobium sp. SMF47]|uniref:Uncharacterized protein n=1 Tax=Aeromicrobium yanjiei TaxID=2662028 RepID=A0A5Q2MH02_9ACTN|nr:MULTISPECIES: hypothetical protein [Aeromicrobium]MRJ76400.1 hypothetical protein [Aeromicrobium yanjiei]MRK00751.1 hypothetical protein [Aeromicrobium sp. S22]QGG42427.1 hypothetical protein GEV26_14170 [Aeromicrobium yanjiei]